MNRRSFLATILAASVAPYIGRADALMRVVPRSFPVCFGRTPIEVPLVYTEDMVETVSLSGNVQSYRYGIERLELYHPGGEVSKVWADGRQVYPGLIGDQIDLGASILGGPSRVIRVSDLDLTPYGNRIPRFTVESDNGRAFPANPYL